MQKIWLLRPVEETAAPWLSYHDCMFGFVVRASNQEVARTLAAKQAGDEGPRAWLSSRFSTCIELTGDGPSTVILEAYNRAR
jgi:hypothetical protein